MSKKVIKNKYQRFFNKKNLPKSKNKTKKKETLLKQLFNYKKTILVVLLLIVIIVSSIFIVYELLNKDTVQDKTSITKSQELKISFKLGIEDRDEFNYIVGRRVVKSYDWSKSFKPAGVEIKKEQAIGMITVINNADYNQPLVATTRFLSEDGVLFRLKNRVVVPAQGQIEAEVYSDVSGKGGNIKPTSFTIPGLPATVQKIIYGESSEQMTGGIKEIGVLTEEDLNNSKIIGEKRAIKEVKDKFLNDIKNEYRDKYVALENLVDVNILSVEFSNQAGDEVDEFNINVKVRVDLLAFLSDDVYFLLSEQNFSEFNNDYNLIVQDYQVSNFDKENYWAELIVNVLVE